MAVMMHMDWAGVTREQYQQLRTLVDWEGKPPAGAQFHVAAFSDAGIRVVDIWDSAEQFQAFLEQRLLPGVAQLGVSGQPSVEFLAVQAVFAPNVKPF